MRNLIKKAILSTLFIRNKQSVDRAIDEIIDELTREGYVVMSAEHLDRIKRDAYNQGGEDHQSNIESV